MTDMDCTAAKLKGYNILLKFKDGEELLLGIEFFNEEDESEWFEDVEKFISGHLEVVFPVNNMAISRDTVKYVKKI